MVLLLPPDPFDLGYTLCPPCLNAIERGGTHDCLGYFDVWCGCVCPDLIEG